VQAEALCRRVELASDSDGIASELLAAEAYAAVNRLAPGAGVMMQAVWFDAGDAKPGRLLVVVHHLVVDGVSWRILLGPHSGRGPAGKSKKQKAQHGSRS
jgi:aspartate racemase